MLLPYQREEHTCMMFFPGQTEGQKPHKVPFHDGTIWFETDTTKMSLRLIPKKSELVVFESRRMGRLLARLVAKADALGSVMPLVETDDLSELSSGWDSPVDWLTALLDGERIQESER